MSTATQGEKPVDSSTRDAMTRGLVDLLKPACDEIDDRVRTVRFGCLLLHTFIIIIQIQYILVIIWLFDLTSNIDRIDSRSRDLEKKLICLE